MGGCFVSVHASPVARLAVGARSPARGRDRDVLRSLSIVRKFPGAIVIENAFA
jgi:hypothetical protein